MSDSTDNGSRHDLVATGQAEPRILLDNLLEGFQVISPDFRYVYVNQAAARHGLRTSEELIGHTMSEEYPGIEETKMFSMLCQCLKDRAPLQMENEFVYPGGTKGWFELRFESVSEGVAVFSIDISQRKLAEDALRRSTRALAVVSDSNHALVHAADEPELLRNVCDIAVSRGGYRLAWIGVKVEDETRAVRPVAVAGADEGYATSLHITWDDSPHGRGPTGRAIRTGEPVIARHLDTEADYEPWRKAALELGYASSIALPFKVDGEVAGALNIYASEPDAFDDNERTVLEALSLDVGYGITTLRGRLAQQELSAEYRVLFENSLDAILLTAPDGRILRANPAACRLFGRTEDDICRVGRAGLVDPDDPRVSALLEERARTGKTSGQISMIRQDGTRFEVEISSAIFESAGGPRTSMVIHDVTERVEAAEMLRQSEHRYALLLEHAPVGIAVHSEGKVVFANPAAARNLGFGSPEELVGTPTEKIIHPDGRAAAMERFGRLLAGEPWLHPIEDQAVRRDGSVTDVEVMAVPLTFQGRPAIQVIATDITERKAAENRIVHLNSVLRGIRNVNQLITRERDPQALIRQTCELLVDARGFSTSCIVVSDGERILDSADAGVELGLHSLRRMLTNGTLPDCIKRALLQPGAHVRQDTATTCRDCPANQAHIGGSDAITVRLESEGKVFGALLVSLHPGPGADPGEIDLLQEIAGDVSFALRSIELEIGRDDAERALVGEQDRYRELVANLEDVVFSVDAGGRVQFMSTAVERVYGFKPDEVLCKHFSEFVHEEDHPGLAASFGRTLHGAVEPHEFRGYDKNGRLRYLRSTSRLRLEDAVRLERMASSSTSPSSDRRKRVSSRSANAWRD